MARAERLGSADTIAAPITAEHSPRRAAVRVSGALAPAAAQALLGLRPPLAWAAQPAVLKLEGNAGAILNVPVLALTMPAGRSYTLEPVLEIHYPANTALTCGLLERLYAMGIRPAAPGEFTRRAYLHGRISLPQAAAVAELIAARDGEERRAALGLLAGEAVLLKDLKERVLRLRLYLEAAVDFPEEPDVAASGADFSVLIGELRSFVDARRRQLRALTPAAYLPRVLLLGPANAGKSSLVRSLIPGAQPLVSALPGTTLDLVPYTLVIGDQRLLLYDAPGTKETGAGPDFQSLAALDEKLAAFDAYLCLQTPGAAYRVPSLPEGRRVFTLHGKADLVPKGRRQGAGLWVSALSGEGLLELKNLLADFAVHWPAPVSPWRALELRALSLAEEALTRAVPLLEGPQRREELAAYEIDELLSELDNLLREEGGSEALLDNVFRNFCIGK